MSCWKIKTLVSALFISAMNVLPINAETEIRADASPSQGFQQLGAQLSATDDTLLLDSLSVENVSSTLSRLLIIPADGQSNMVGFGRINNQGSDDTVLPNMFQLSQGENDYYPAGNDGDVIPATQPLQFRPDLPGNINSNNVSLAFYFARCMALAYPDSDILIVPTAQGSTGYFENHWGIGDVLLNRAITRVNAAITYGHANYDEVIIPAWLYHQGEDDSSSSRLPVIQSELAPALEHRRTQFAAFGIFPIILGEVCHTSNRTAVNPILNAVPNTVAATAVISTSQYTNAADTLHYTGAELKSIGKDYFDTWQNSFNFLGPPIAPTAPYVLTTTQSASPPVMSSSDLAQTEYLSSSATGGDTVGTRHAELFNGIIGDNNSSTRDLGVIRMTSANTFTVELDTSLNTLGYNISEITSAFGWDPASGGRSNQGYEIILTFVDNTSATLAGPAHWEPNNPASFWTTVSFTSSAGADMASGVKAITFNITQDANASGVVIAREFDIFGTPTTLPLEDWRFANFGTSDNIGVAADDFDADFDGIVNLVEYATGLDPNDSSEANPIQVGPSLMNPGEVEVTFNRITDPALNYALEGTNDLSAPIWPEIWLGTGTANDTITIPESMWPSNQTEYFFRLRVSY